MKFPITHPTALAAIILSLTLVAQADSNNPQKRHIQLLTPMPYIWDEYGPTNPLNPNGSDYPCKVPHGEPFRVANGGQPTEVTIGEPHPVTLSGWAVHGGGSCQFALAPGLSPSPGTVWSVVHSVEGGCPKAGAAGNLVEGGQEEPDGYTFTVPEGFGAGEYTFAWTWVNRIGGVPEFYMNCAPITIKAAGAGAGGSAARARRKKERGRVVRRAASYPDLFLANIGDAGNGCTTTEAWAKQVAIRYPYPGDSVSYPDGTADLFDQPCDGNPRNGLAASNGTAASSSASGGTAGASSLTTGVSGAISTTSSSTDSLLTSSPSGLRST